MFKEIFLKKKENIPRWWTLGQRCGHGHIHTMVKGWQANDHGHIRGFMELEMFIRVKDSFHKQVSST